MSKESKPQRITEGHKPPLAPVDQRRPEPEQFVIPDKDVEKHSYKPPLGPVDQAPPPEDPPGNPQATK